jgi:hypothetical protein
MCFTSQDLKRKRRFRHIHRLLPLDSITLNPTPIKRSIIPQRKLGHIIRHPMFAPEAFPRQFIVPRPFTRVRKRQMKVIRVFQIRALSLYE